MKLGGAGCPAPSSIADSREAKLGWNALVLNPQTDSKSQKLLHSHFMVKCNVREGFDCSHDLEIPIRPPMNPDAAPGSSLAARGRTLIVGNKRYR